MIEVSTLIWFRYC